MMKDICIYIDEKLTLNKQSKILERTPKDASNVIEKIFNYFIMANYFTPDLIDLIKSSIEKWVYGEKRLWSEYLYGPYLDCKDENWKQDFSKRKFSEYEKDEYVYFSITNSGSPINTYIETYEEGKHYTLAGNKDGIYFIIGKKINESYTEMCIAFTYDF